jgi:ABC-type multidrug transport system ATPase subunit
VNIILDNAGKKFSTEWIFRGVSRVFEPGNPTAILGRNGSGKSTLLQVIAGSIHPTAGTVQYFNDEGAVSPAAVFRQVSLVAPYQELIEEFTLTEMLRFHFSFKQLLPGHTIPGLKDLLNLGSVEYKQIRQFSSGMKQRVKLILALLSDTPVLLLDEPTNNLDQAGIEWYMDLVGKYTTGRTVIVCSNLEAQETGFCKGALHIGDYKS